MNIDDIPNTYGIEYVPSVETDYELYFPTYKGLYIFSTYKTYHDDTASSMGHGIRCKSKEEAIKVIREHMNWKAPRVLKREEWLT